MKKLVMVQQVLLFQVIKNLIYTYFDFFFEILAGELLAQTEQYLQQGLHATVIIRAYRKALEDCIEIMKTKASIPIDVNNRDEMLRVVKSCIGTKYLSRWLV